MNIVGELYSPLKKTSVNLIELVVVIIVVELIDKIN